MTRKRTPIKDSEWRITTQLVVGDQPVGEPFVLCYSDSYLAKEPTNVGWCVSHALEEAALRLKPQARKAKK